MLTSGQNVVGKWKKTHYFTLYMPYKRLKILSNISFCFENFTNIVSSTLLPHHHHPHHHHLHTHTQHHHHHHHHHLNMALTLNSHIFSLMRANSDRDLIVCWHQPTMVLLKPRLPPPRFFIFFLILGFYLPQSCFLNFSFFICPHLAVFDPLRLRLRLRLHRPPGLCTLASSTWALGHSGTWALVNSGTWALANSGTAGLVSGAEGSCSLPSRQLCTCAFFLQTSHLSPSWLASFSQNKKC